MCLYKWIFHDQPPSYAEKKDQPKENAPAANSEEKAEGTAPLLWNACEILRFCH